MSELCEPTERCELSEPTSRNQVEVNQINKPSEPRSVLSEPRIEEHVNMLNKVKKDEERGKPPCEPGEQETRGTKREVSKMSRMNQKNQMNLVGQVNRVNQASYVAEAILTSHTRGNVWKD